MMPPSPNDPAAPDAAGEKLIIETPEQTSIEFPLAGIGSRFLAVLIDSLFQFGVLIAFGLIVLAISATGGRARLGGLPTGIVWLWAIFILVYFVLMYGYFILFEAIWNGQTPGKRITHLRVIKDSGQPITAIDSVGRNLMRIIDQLPFAYGIGVLCASISSQSKRLGDYVAGTVVVHEKPLETVAPRWDAGAQSGLHRYGASRLTPEEFVLVETFLSRRAALDAGVRYDTAAGILRRIEAKLTLPAEKPSAEKILEELSHERRSTGSYL
jgi:uncharacterized RDD family membrane protein YckC